MQIIYKPSGRAAEYSTLACNLWSGCSHRCRYCYVPGVMRMKRQDWEHEQRPVKDGLKRLEHDLQNMPEEHKELSLLFSFMCDPYQSPACASDTRLALELCSKYGMTNVHVLTKNPEEAWADRDLFFDNPGWTMSTTLSFVDEYLRRYWEPCAPSIESRIRAMKKWHEYGLRTWISIEPVIDPDQAIQVVLQTYEFCPEYKVGMLNYCKPEMVIDWPSFRQRIQFLCAGLGRKLVVKKDLMEAK